MDSSDRAREELVGRQNAAPATVVSPVPSGPDRGARLPPRPDLLRSVVRRGRIPSGSGSGSSELAEDGSPPAVPAVVGHFVLVGRWSTLPSGFFVVRIAMLRGMESAPLSEDEQMRRGWATRLAQILKRDRPITGS